MYVTGEDPTNSRIVSKFSEDALTLPLSMDLEWSVANVLLLLNVESLFEMLNVPNILRIQLVFVITSFDNKRSKFMSSRIRRNEATSDRQENMIFKSFDASDPDWVIENGGEKAIRLEDSFSDEHWCSLSRAVAISRKAL